MPLTESKLEQMKAACEALKGVDKAADITHAKPQFVNYISVCNPANVLELIAHVERSRKDFPEPAAESTELRGGYWPTLLNCGDGVDGHYCIGRLIKPPEPYWQFWNKGRWVSAGEVFVGKQAAEAELDRIMRDLFNVAAAPEPAAESTELRVVRDEHYRAGPREIDGENSPYVPDDRLATVVVSFGELRRVRAALEQFSTTAPAAEGDLISRKSALTCLKSAARAWKEHERIKMVIGQIVNEVKVLPAAHAAPAAVAEDSVPWCEPCQSYHAMPRDAAHKAALGCVAPAAAQEDAEIQAIKARANNAISFSAECYRQDVRYLLSRLGQRQ